MKLTEIQLKIETYTSAEELSSADRELLELADEAIGRAYAPYSHYRVGAALRLDNGEIYTGNNQENGGRGC